MAKASKKHFGAGAQGPHSGSGAMTDLPPDGIVDNMVLSNRDKAQHSKARGADSKEIATEQMQDHALNRLHDDEPRRRK